MGVLEALVVLFPLFFPMFVAFWPVLLPFLLFVAVLFCVATLGAVFFFSFLFSFLCWRSFIIFGYLVHLVVLAPTGIGSRAGYCFNIHNSQETPFGEALPTRSIEILHFRHPHRSSLKSLIRIPIS